MAFPSIAEITVTVFSTPATSHLVNMPATVAVGDLLLILFSNRTNTAADTPTGWTQLGQFRHNTTGAGWTTIFGKDAIGNEDGTTVDVTTAASSCNAAAQVYRITAASWNGTLGTDVAISAGAAGSSTAPDPAGLTPSWGALDTLWIAVEGHSSAGDTTDVTAYPTNYTNGTFSESTGANPDAAVGSARRELNAASDDPGAFTLAGTQIWAAFTVAVRPAAAGGQVFNESPLATFLLLPSLLDIGSLVDRPGVGAVLTSQERDTASLVERPGIPLGVSTSERDFRTLAERPGVTALLVPNVSDLASLKDISDVSLALLANALSLQVMLERPGASLSFTPTAKDIGVFVETTRSPARSFDGIDDYVSIAHHAVLATNAFTLEAWVYLSEGPRQQVAVGKTENYFLWWDGSPLEEGELPKVRVEFRNATDTAYRGIPQDGGNTYVLPLGIWVHLAGIFGGSGATIRLYANGILVSETGVINENPKQDGDILAIGRWPVGFATRFWKGSIDEVRVWNFARTQADIQRDMSRRLSGIESGLVGYWRLDELEGSTAVDATGNMNGTINGAVRTTRPLFGFSVDAVPRDAAVQVERPAVTAIVSPSIKDLRSLVEKPGVSAIITPAVLGLQTMVDKPGVGTVITAQEADTATLVERPSLVAAFQSAVSDVASLIDRPLNTVVVSPTVSDRMTAFDVVSATLALMPQALAVAVFVDRPQIGAIVILPTVTDVFVGAAETFDEVVTVIETIVASVLDRLSGIDRPSVTVAISPAVLGLQTMENRPGIGVVLVVQEQDTTSFVERPLIAESLAPAVRDAAALVDRPSVVSVLVPDIRDLASLKETPGVIAALIGSERDAAVFQDRPSLAVVLQTAVRDAASLVDRPLTSIVLAPSAAANMTAVDAALLALTLVPQAVSVAAFIERQQVGIIVVLPSVTDVLVGAGQTFDEIVAITETILASVLDRLVGVDRPSAVMAIAPAVLGIQTMVDKPGISAVLVPSVRDARVLVERPAVAAAVIPGVSALHSMTERPSAVVAVSLSALGIQTMQEQPGVGAVLVIQERDTASLTDRPGAVLGVSPGVGDFRTLVERPSVTAALQPSVSDVAGMVDTASVVFALVPQAASVAVLRDNPQIGVVILLPGVTDVFIGAEGPQIFSETVTVIETIIASVSDQLVGIERPAVILVVSGALDETLVEFLAGRMGRRVVVVDAQGRILIQRDRGDILTSARSAATVSRRRQ